MLSIIKSRLSHINTDKIDYDYFYTYTYGKQWNEKICTNIDNDEALRIIYTCYIFIEKENTKISSIWKEASNYVMKNFPYDDLQTLYIDMGIHLGLSKNKSLEIYNQSQAFEGVNELLDLFYKWIYNELMNNVDYPVKTDQEKNEKTSIIKENLEIIKKPVKKPVKKTKSKETKEEIKPDNEPVKKTKSKETKEEIKPDNETTKNTKFEEIKKDNSSKKPIKKPVKPVKK